MKKLAFIRRHWFWLLVLAFVGYALLLDDHSFVKWMGYRHKQNLLEREISAYRDSIAIYERSIEEVSGDHDELEKFAREKLMMKRANEDVYLIK